MIIHCEETGREWEVTRVRLEDKLEIVGHIFGHYRRGHHMLIDDIRKASASIETRCRRFGKVDPETGVYVVPADKFISVFTTTISAYCERAAHKESFYEQLAQVIQIFTLERYRPDMVKTFFQTNGTEWRDWYKI